MTGARGAPERQGQTICIASDIWSIILTTVAAKSTKVTVNLPTATLARARSLTGKGITATILDGLEELERRAHRSALRALRGKVRLELNLERTRR